MNSCRCRSLAIIASNVMKGILWLNCVLIAITSLPLFTEARAAEPTYIITPSDVTTDLGKSVNFTCGIKISKVKEEQDTIRYLLINQFKIFQ